MGDVLEFGHAKCLSEVLLRRSTEDQLALVWVSHTSLRYSY